MQQYLVENDDFDANLEKEDSNNDVVKELPLTT